MTMVQVVLPAGATRKWHGELIARLVSEGREVSVTYSEGACHRERILNLILRIERALFRVDGFPLADPSPRIPPSQSSRAPELVIDLSGYEPPHHQARKTLSVRLDGGSSAIAVAISLCRGSLPVVDAYLDGRHIGRAAPMIDSRISVGRGLSDVFARTITLICKYADVSRPVVDAPDRQNSSRPAERRSGSAALFSAYLFKLLPRLIWRAVRRLRYYGGHWQVAYRFVDGPGVVDTGSLEGTPWVVLPDGGDRFYADPFPFEWQGRFYIFVEELVHSIGKGVISVAEYGDDGAFSMPTKVLEEPYHLSYPQVFSREGEIWMIPESGAGHMVTLYRAREFPTVWERHCVLIRDREIFDATLIDHDGFLWLVGSLREGGGSASDTMVIFSAAELEGPWQQHPMNPILIDRAAARPGGRSVARDGHIVLPLQDGTRLYGGGLGLARLTYLDHDHVDVSSSVPVDVGRNPRFPHIHTLNRCGRLETIDCFSDRIKRA